MLQVIKAEEVRDGEPRWWFVAKEDADASLFDHGWGAESLHTADRVAFKTAHGWTPRFAIVDRPAPTPPPAPGLDLDAVEAALSNPASKTWLVTADKPVLPTLDDDGTDSDDSTETWALSEAHVCNLVNAAYNDGATEISIECHAVMPFDDVTALIAEVRALRAAAEEREADMHARIRAGYDKTVADAWRAEVAKRDAEIARLTADLAAARAVPGDVEAAIDAIECRGCGHGDPVTNADADRLKAAIARAISNATAMPLGGEWALVAAMRDATAQLAVNNDPSSINKGRCDEWANRVAAAVPGATAVWLDSIIDADFPIDAQPRVGHCVVEYSGRWYDSGHPLGVDDVGLLAGLDRGALATAARGTVGGLLATAPECPTWCATHDPRDMATAMDGDRRYASPECRDAGRCLTRGPLPKGG